LPLKKIYIIRHGQTKYNNLGVVQGRGIDASLNTTGQDQAQSFYDYYKHVPFEKIYISSLKRTYESVSSFIEAGIPFEKHEGLDEISWGIHEGAVASEDRNIYFKKMVQSWSAGKTDFPIEGGESPEDVLARQKPALNKILAEAEELILVCMHGRAMRILLCHLLGLPLSEMDRFEHDNLGLYILEYDNDGFTLIESNSTHHLA
jgi:broad specificity phosphatase PhoE